MILKTDIITEAERAINNHGVNDDMKPVKILLILFNHNVTLASPGFARLKRKNDGFLSLLYNIFSSIIQ